MGSWNDSSPGMYVDDGILFACAPEWANVTTPLQAWYTVCDDKRRNSGLAVVLDKTEDMFFQRPGER